MVSWITPALAPGTGIATGAGSSFSPAAASAPARAKPATAKLASDLTGGVTRAGGKTKSKHGSGQSNGIAVAINPSSSKSSLLPILIALLALTGAGLLLWPLVQRRLRTAGGADAGADDEPSPDADGANGAEAASTSNGAPVAGVAASPDASSAQPSARSASAVLSPVGPAGATAAGAAAAGAAAGRAPASGAEEADPAAGRAATTGAEEAGASAPSPPARTPVPAAAPAHARAGHNNGRRAAILAVGSAALMRGLRAALSRRHRRS